MSTLGFDQSYYNDGSMDLHANITNQVERAMYKQSSTDFAKEVTKEEAFDHDRFFVPVQESNSTSTTPTMTANDYYAKPGFFSSSSTRNQKKNTSKRRQIFRHHSSSSAFSSSFSAWPEESTEAMQFTSSLPPSTRRPQSEPPTLVSASNLKAKKKSLGIAPPPKNTNRIIVPSSHSNDNMNSSNYASPKSKDFTAFVLLIEPKKRIFELIRIHYDPSITTLKQLLHLIPDNCTEVELATQSYLGFIRPHARSSSNKALANLNLTASVMARDGSCARIASGEVLAAIPKGFTYKETQVLAKHIMKNPKMQKLLSKKKKKTFSRSSKRSTVSIEVDASEEATSSSFHYSESNDDGTGGVSHLGITPRNSNYERETEAVTDSGIYSSSHSVHSAASLSLTAPGSPAMGKMNKKRMKLQDKIRSSVSLTSDSSRNLVNNSDNSNHDKVAVDRDRRDSGDVSCCSSITTTGTPTRLGKKQKEGIDKRTSKLHVVTNLDMKDILRNMNSPDRPSNRKTVENRLASPAAIDRKNVENRLASPATIDRKNVENRLASPTASERMLDKILESPNRKTESYLVSPGKTSRKPLHHLSYPRTILEGEASTDDVIDTGSVGKLDRFLEESSKKTSNSRLTTRDKKSAVNRLIVDHDDPFQKLASGQIHLDLHQLEEIKREAAEAAKAAAKIAAEAAFAKKMQELIHTLDLPEDEKNCLLDDDDASYYSAMSTAMSVALSPLTSDDASCDFPVNISITGQTPSAPSEVRLMGNQGTRACASEIKVISPYAPPSGTVLLSPLMPMSHQKPNASSFSPIPSLTVSTPDTVEIVKRDSMYRSNPNSTSTYTQSTSDDEYSELSLIAETMEGFKGLAMDKVSKFIAKNTKSFGQVPSKMLKQKLHLKVMASVCMAFVVSQGLSGVDENDDIGTLSRELLFKDESAVSFTHDVGSDMGEDLRKFSVSDLQCILFCFLVLTKGQKFLSHARSAKRKRRTWKSRVIPVN